MATERGQDQAKPHIRAVRGFRHLGSQEQRTGRFRHFAEPVSFVSFNCHGWKK